MSIQEAGNTRMLHDDVAGFWRRWGSMAVDGIVLGVAGAVLGAVGFEALSWMGVWGRLFGFVVAGIYFVLMDSRIGGGASIGKRALGIRVVDAAGQLVSPWRAAVRYAVFGVPFFLNGAQIGGPATMSWMIYPLSVVVFGLSLGMAYTMIFNRRTRQGLHDLAAGTFVVRREEVGLSLDVRVWRGHLVVAGVLALVTLIAPPVAQRLMRGYETGGMKYDFDGMIRAQTAIVALPRVRGATLQESLTPHVLSAGVMVGSGDWNDPQLARQVALELIDRIDKGADADRVAVRMVYGFDIGFASAWKVQVFAHTPSEWRAGP